MKKLLLLFSFVLSAAVCFCQPIVNRAGSANTVSDARLRAQFNFYLPRYADTTAASVVPSIGIDSCGALIYTYTDNKTWVRKCSPKRWEEVGGSGTVPTWQQTLLVPNGSELTTGNQINGNSSNFTWGGFNSYIFDAQDFRVDAASELNLATLDSMRLIGINESATTGLYIPLLNPVTGAVTKVSASSVGSGNLQQVTDIGALTSNATTFGNKDSVGNVVSYSWATTPLGAQITNSLTTATATTGSSRTRLTGGGYNLSNPLTVANLYAGVENITISGTAVQKNYNTSSDGFGVNISNFSGGGFMAHFLLASDVNALAFTLSTNLPNLSTDINTQATAKFTRSAGDTLDWKVIRRSRQVQVFIQNRANGSSMQLAEDNYVFNQVGQISIYTYGDTLDLVGDLIVRYDEPYQPSLAAVGDSHLYGGNANSEGQSFWVNGAQGFRAVRMSGPGETSFQGWQRIGDIQRVDPDVLLWFYGTNDFNGGGNIDSFCNRTIRVIQNRQAVGKRVLLSTIIPQSSSVVVWNDSIIAIGARYGVRVMPTFTDLKDASSTGLASQFSYGDGVHMNSNGHREEGALLRAELKAMGLREYIPLRIGNIPQNAAARDGNAANFAGEVVTDDSMALLRLIPGTNPKYIWATQNLTTSNALASRQSGGINIDGPLYVIGDMIRFAPPGTSFTGSPVFDVDIFGVRTNRTRIASLAGTAAFDLRTNLGIIDGVPVLMQTGAYFNPRLQTFGVTTFNPSAALVGITVGNEAATVPADYKLFSGTINTGSGNVERMFINRGGGVRTDTTSGYMHPYSYAALANDDWITKRQNDSLRALISVAWNSITDPTGSQSLTHGNGEETVWTDQNTSGTFFSILTSITSGTTESIVSGALTSGTLFGITSTSTGHTGAMELFNLSSNGANANSTVTTTGSRITLSNTGTASTNRGLDINITAGTNQVGVLSTIASQSLSSVAVDARGGIRIGITGSDATTPHLIYATSGNVTEWRVGSAGITGSGNGDAYWYNGNGVSGYGMILDYQSLNLGIYGGATIFTPTAKAHISPGSATASTAPLKFTSGTNLTTAEAGAIEYDGTQLYETNSTATRGTVPVIRPIVSSAGTLAMAVTSTHYVFTGTTTTWTLPTVTGNTNSIIWIKNAGSGDITLNSNAGGNDIYDTAAVSTITIGAGAARMLILANSLWYVH